MRSPIGNLPKRGRHMKRATTSLLSLGSAFAILALMSTTASAVLRVPQVVYNSASVQAYFNSQGESAIDADNDQEDIQSWSTTFLGNSSFTLMIELSASANANAIGI